MKVAKKFGACFLFLATEVQLSLYIQPNFSSASLSAPMCPTRQAGSEPVEPRILEKPVALKEQNRATLYIPCKTDTKEPVQPYRIPCNKHQKSPVQPFRKPGKGEDPKSSGHGRDFWQVLFFVGHRWLASRLLQLKRKSLHMPLDVRAIYFAHLTPSFWVALFLRVQLSVLWLVEGTNPLKRDTHLHIYCTAICL